MRTHIDRREELQSTKNCCVRWSESADPGCTHVHSRRTSEWDLPLQRSRTHRREASMVAMSATTATSNGTRATTPAMRRCHRRAKPELILLVDRRQSIPEVGRRGHCSTARGRRTRALTSRRAVRSFGHDCGSWCSCER
jgi:hypothetical protein